MTRLGQHFLTNHSVLRSVAESVDIHPGDTVIEIGPGHGELTQELLRLKDAGRIVAIERDAKLAEALRAKFADNAAIEIVEGDALKVVPQIAHERRLITKTFVLIGNIPYYITGRLLRVVSGLEHPPRQTVLTIQKEVAERMTAEAPRMNRLAAMVRMWAIPQMLRTVPRDDFSPPPDVDSAVVRLDAGNKLDAHERAGYEQVARAAFGQPRKTILNNLGAHFPPADVRTVLERLRIDPSARPQDLSAQNLSELARALTPLRRTRTPAG